MIMHTLNHLQWHVIDVLADDWESITQIRPHVNEWCGQTTDRHIFDTLRELHGEGFVRIMDAEGHETTAFPENPSDHWFDMTPSGRSLWDAEGIKYRGE